MLTPEQQSQTFGCQLDWSVLRLLLRSPAVDLTKIVASMSDVDKLQAFELIQEEYIQENLAFKA